MKIISQREQYLAKRRAERYFWPLVAELYNQGEPVDSIRKRFINPRTGRPYCREHIYAILRELKTS